MSKVEIWLVVEGRDHDRPHYGRLLDALPSTSGRSIAIRLAEEIEIDGTSAGGKNHVLALHDHLQATGGLTVRNKLMKSTIVFMVDRDLDDYLGVTRTSDHVLYTHGSDVEADILLHADIWTALCDAYGIDKGLAGRVRQAVSDPPRELLALWRAWLSISLIALECGMPRYAPWGSPSQFNVDTFDHADLQKVEAVDSELRSEVESGSYELASAKASQHLSTHGVRLLKGRWIAHYISYLVERHLKDEIIRSKVPRNAVIDTALSSVEYDGAWVQAYDARFAKLLDAGSREREAFPEAS